jgi:glycosyltransferase involved in cell wall biosynthesis
VKDFSHLEAPGITARPPVSVLMPVFNTARYLQDALDSIGNQTVEDFELVVIDDGSADGSTKILESFAAREKRMRLVTRENRGLIATRNELLEEARGEFVAWMDSDDISSPDRLASQLRGFAAGLPGERGPMHRSRR